MNCMNGKCFVDTNILVYAHDRSAGVKHDRARTLVEQLWISGQGVLSTQVLQELCVNLRRKVRRPWPAAEVRKLVQDYTSWEVITNSAESIIEALEIEQRYRLSFWDALIVHAAEVSGASVLYSEDFPPGQRYHGIPVVNPLTASKGEVQGPDLISHNVGQ